MLLYGGPFLLLASIPLFFYGLGAAGPFATIAALLALLIGAEFVSPRGDVLIVLHKHLSHPSGHFRRHWHDKRLHAGLLRVGGQPVCQQVPDEA